jgi:threonine dehydrogenase-like Zn-dependent dehydrogenase
MVDIPTLDIEDYDPDLNEEQETVEDKSGGALTYAIVGAGQGGGRMAKAFYDMGYTKTVAVNTARSDLNGLDIPEEQKFLVDEHGDQGAGKDQAKAEAAIERKEQEVFNKFREVFGNNVDRILICLGVSGGSGGGTVNTLIKVAKKYFTYIGVENVDERVGVVASLPTAGDYIQNLQSRSFGKQLTTQSLACFMSLMYWQTKTQNTQPLTLQTTTVL